MPIRESRAVFVAGTGTGAGKSVVCGLLARFLLEKNYKVITQKWVQTGSTGWGPDIEMHLKLMKRNKGDVKEFISCMVPYSFKFAASPHLASKLEKTVISPDRIKRSLKVLRNNFEFVVIEGTGGVMVPFNRRRVLTDIAADIGLPVLVVVNNKLGAVNHALLTIEALKKRRLRICGIIFNNLETGEEEVILKDNINITGILGREKVLGCLPCSEDEEYLYKSFIPLGRRVLSVLKQGG